MKWKTAATASPENPLYRVFKKRRRGAGKSKTFAVLAIITSQNLDPVRRL